MTINFRNKQEYARVNNPNCDEQPWPGPDDEYAPSERCDIGFKPRNNEGKDWNASAPYWISQGSCYSGYSTPQGDAVCTNAAVSPGGYGGVWNVTGHPFELYWRGYICDELMFWARVCHDYSLTLFGRLDFEGGRAYREVAQHLSRYVLRYIVHYSQFLVHELGHCYISGDNHCHGWARCCFDLAAKAFMCRVRGRLGLPMNEFYSPDDLDDFNNPTSLFTNTWASCGQDSGVYQRVGVHCDTQVEGEPCHEAEFIGTSLDCVDSSS